MGSSYMRSEYETKNVQTSLGRMASGGIAIGGNNIVRLGKQSAGEQLNGNIGGNNHVEKH